MDASERELTGCQSRYSVTDDTVLKCEQHLGPPGGQKHSARHMGIRVYWTDGEADWW